MVRRRQRGERDFVVTGTRETVHHGRDDRVGISLANGTIDHSRLAKPASTVAAAQDFDGKAVMHEFAIWHDLARQGVERIEVADDALFDTCGDIRIAGSHRRVATRPPCQMIIANRMFLDIVESRDVDALDAGKLAQDLRARRPPPFELAVPEHRLEVDLLALAHEDGIEEGGEGLGIVCARPAAKDEGVVLGALAGMQGDTAQVEELEDVRGTQLVGQGDAHEVEIAHGRIRLERCERQVMGAHEGDHVNPRQIGALAVDALVGVQTIVEYGDGLVRLADLVCVRIHEHRMVVGLAFLGRRDAAPFLAEVARRLLDAIEKLRISLPEIGFLHAISPIRSALRTMRSVVPQRLGARGRVTHDGADQIGTLVDDGSRLLRGLGRDF